MSSARPTVLAVDDDEDFCALLELAWHSVATQATLSTVRSVAGLWAWVEQHGLPSVVTVDLHLDGESGLAVIRQIRSMDRTAGLPILVLSSASGAQDIADAYAAGAQGFVRKPLGVGRTASVLQAIDAYWLQVNLATPGVAATR